METLSLAGDKKKARRLKAHLVFLDESGFLLIPNVRRTWAPRGKTPVIYHRYRHEKISAISAVTVSAQRQRLGLYVHFHCCNITQTEVAIFLRDLLRHLHGHVVLLWDGGTIHKGDDVQRVLRRHPRLRYEPFPAYAPQLNPDEWVWRHLKHELANGRPDNLDELMDTLCDLTRKARKRRELITSFVTASELPPFLGR
jgi:putative transposase